MNPTLFRQRRLIALAGMALQLCLGSVYAWSYFQDLLVKDKVTYGWSDIQVSWAFSLAICFLGLAAAWGGVQLPRFGPRKLAVTGGLLFGLGYLLAALALSWKSLPLLYLGYGVVGGSGLGLGYVTPVATVAKWFPDKKGLATGMVVMGFGLGALLMSKVFAPRLCEFCDGNLAMVFAWLGIGFTVATVAAASILRNPPAGFDVTGGTATADSAVQSNIPAEPVIGSGRLRFACMWLVFFCNILAGISVISFLSQLFQGLWAARVPSLEAKTLAAYGATLIAVSSLFNGVGRMFWGGLSDRIGRVRTFRLMMAGQVVVFVMLAGIGNPWLFGGLICYVLLCYGGGFGAMPSLVLDTFGLKRMAVNYGFILTAWSAAGIAGPQIVAMLRVGAAEHFETVAFLTNAAVLVLGLLATLGLKEVGKGDGTG